MVTPLEATYVAHGTQAEESTIDHWILDGSMRARASTAILPGVEGRAGTGDADVRGHNAVELTLRVLGEASASEARAAGVDQREPRLPPLDEGGKEQFRKLAPGAWRAAVEEVEALVDGIGLPERGAAATRSSMAGPFFPEGCL